MITSQPTQLTFAQLFDALPEAVAYFKAIMDEQDRIIDFVVDYANPKAQDYAAGSYQATVGTSLRYGNPHDPALAERTFPALCTVVETGKARDYEYFSPILNEWLLVSQTKSGNGILNIVRLTTARKEAELELQQQTRQLNQQNKLLKSILDTSLSNVFVYEAIRDTGPDGQPGPIRDFNILLINQQARLDSLRLLNADPTGSTLLYINPDSRQTGQFDLYCRVTETGQAVQTEQFYPTPHVWYNTLVTKLNDGCIVTGVNITAQKQAALAINRQAELLNSVLDSSISGIMAFEAIRDATQRIIDFRFLIANRASMALVGKTMDEMIGSRLLTLFPGNTESGLFDFYTHTTETGEPGRREVYYNHDGLDFWIDVSAQKLGDGFVVTFTDVSIAKRAAQLAAQSAAASERQTELLNTVLNNSQAAISLHESIRDASGTIIDFRTVLANRRTLDMWGGMADAIMSQTFFEVATPEQQAVDFRKYVDVVETGEPDLTELTIGDQWLLRLTAKSGDGVVISHVDITQIHRLQQQLEASVVDLQRSNANLEQFAYVASHDLQEPLRKIQAFGDIIQTQFAPLLGETGADLVQRMQASARRMQMLIKDVLAYSRIATKRENVSLVDLNDICSEVLENLETAIADKQALVTIGPLPVITGDAPQLRQLMQNLISNALKFGKPGTQPQINIRSRSVLGCDSGMSLLTPDANRLFYMLEVQDDGIGFDPQYAERIFQVFQRLHSRNRFEGTGIGLAIVQKVIENHQGYIEAQGKPNEGATFRILLPVVVS